MSRTNQPEEAHAWEQWREREALLDRFEAAWRGGERPAIDDYRPLGAADDDALLAELVQTDLEFRLKEGEPARVETYLERYPGLAGDDETVLALVAAEYELRQRREPGLDIEEYTQRFPGRDETLRARLQRAGKSRVTVPGYEVLGELGRGGMGVVYRARQTNLNRTVALKMILAAVHTGPSETARFRREAEAAARLQHPNIVQVYEVGEEAGLPYLVMEYVEGGSLAERFAGMPVDARRAAGLLETLARTTHAAHQHGIIHRDLKPANVLLTADDTPKITDFGLAKQMEQEAHHTHSGAILGTPAYMAPEQAAGHSAAVGCWSDVYALGAILYELLTGRPPFQGATPLATLQQVVSEEPAAPSRLQPGLPVDLETICLKCLHKEPGRRYGSALELAEDLRRFLNGEPIRARPVGLWEQARKWARRRPAAAALLAVSLVAVLGLAGGIVAFTGYLHSALEQRTEELEQTQGEQLREAAHHQQEMKEIEYALDLRLGYQAWRNGLLNDVQHSLSRQMPAAGDEDQREFAWYYLRRQSDRVRATFRGHTQAALCGAFSPDGKTLATGGRDAKVILWDLVTGQVRATLSGHLAWVHAVAFSPDGATLVSASDAIRLWDVARGKERAILRGHKSGATSLAISPDGKWLASGGWDDVTKLWDLGSLTERATLAVPPSLLYSVAFTPDSKTLACGYANGVVLSDVVAGTVHPGQWDVGVRSIAFSPDGRTLAAEQGNTIALCDVPSGVRRGTLSGHQGQVLSLAFSPDGRTLASAGGDGTVRLWDPTSGRMKAVLRDHLGVVHAVAFSPDGATLASVADDQTVKLWDPTDRREHEELAVPLSATGAVVYSPDGKTLALAGRDRSVQLLDVTTERVKTSLRGHCSDLLGVHFSPDGPTLATADEGGLVRLWNVARGEGQFLFTCAPGHVQRVAFSPAGRLLAAAGEDRIVRLYDLKTGQERATFPGHAREVAALAFAPDGKTLVTACLGGFVKQWDLDAGKERASTSGQPGVLAVAFTPDGRTFATGHRGVIRLWDTASNKPLGDLNREKPNQFDVSCLAFSPDGQSLLSGGEERELCIWDVPTRTVRKIIRWIQGPTYGLTFSPDGKTFAVVSGGGAVRLWDWDRWTARKPAGQPPRPVRALTFSPDGRTLATGSGYDSHGEEKVLLPIRQVRATAVRTHLGKVRWEQATPENDDLRLWDVASRQELARLPGQTTFGTASLLFARDGRTLVAGGSDGTIGLWDLGARKSRPLAFLDSHAKAVRRNWEGTQALGVPMNPEFFKEAVWRTSLSPDGKLLATAGNAGTVKLWDLPECRERAVLPTISGPACVAFAPEGATLALSTGGEIRLWDVAQERTRHKLSGDRGEILCLAFSPDGTLLAAGTWDWHIVLWDLRSGRQKVVLSGHRDAVASLAFSPDGRTLASGSQDGTVRLWHVATAQELAVLEGHTGKVHCVAFSPDGNTLATGGETLEGTGEVYLWRASPPDRPVH